MTCFCGVSCPLLGNEEEVDMIEKLDLSSSPSDKGTKAVVSKKLDRRYHWYWGGSTVLS